MSIGQEIIAGLHEAVGYMDGTADTAEFCAHSVPAGRIPEAIDVKALRQRMGISQPAFASMFGLSLSTLRNWEQGKRRPDPAARAYLKVIEAAPDVVRRVLCG